MLCKSVIASKQIDNRSDKSDKNNREEPCNCGPSTWHWCPGPAGRVAVLLIRPHTGGVGHHMGDITLLVHPMEEVSHRAVGVYWHILAGVRDVYRLPQALLHVVGVVCFVVGDVSAGGVVQAAGAAAAVG